MWPHSSEGNVLADMCCWCNRKVKKEKVCNVYNSDGEISEINGKDNVNLCNLPEHVDDPYLDRNIQNGVLGFRYETKQSLIIVYSSIEAKTFCMLMRLDPLR